jgi:ferrochelatase
VDVVCPGFTSDCLETLEEINSRKRARPFCTRAARPSSYIPCLNDMPQWIQALGGLVEQHLAGWPTRTALDAAALAAQREAALALGAPR